MNKILLSITILFFALTSIGQNALHFDGTNDRVDCGNSTAVQLSGTAITLEAWIKPTAFGTEVWKNNIIDKETWTPQQGYMLRCGAGGKLNFNLGGGSGWNELTTATAVLTLNTWHHVAGTYDGSYMRLYVDGVCTDSIAKSVSFVNASTSNLVIGDNTQMGRNFAGWIDEVRIWSVARTKAQIVANMNQEICGGQSGLAAYYRFNQGVAGGTNTTVTSALNSASNGTAATLSSFALSGSTSNWVTGQTLTATQNYGGDTIYDTFCAGSTYTFGSQSLNSAGTYDETFYTAAGCDSIVTLILSELQGVTHSFNDTICQGGSYTFNGQTITNPGTYTATFPASNGCDSVVSVVLAYRTLDLNVIHLAGDTKIEVGETGASYQWLACGNGMAPIAGATSQSYAPTIKGFYACIVTKMGCSDTTECILVNQITSIQNSELKHNTKVYPIPTNQELNIDFNSNDNKDIKVVNSLGQTVLHTTSKETTIKLDLANLPKGVYVLTITNQNETYSKKFILE
jgi:hypothetical protein